MPSLLERLGQFMATSYGGRHPSQSSAAPSGGQVSTVQGPPAGSASGGTTAMSDPVVQQVNQQMASQQAQPVPTEDEQLQQEQHQAWANYDFERCIVIFSRLHQLHPDDPSFKEKLVASYFNRGKQYENENNVPQAVQCYYAALAVDPEFPQAKEAAEQLLANQGQGQTSA